MHVQIITVIKNQTCGREVTEPKQKLLYSSALDWNLPTTNVTLVRLEFENDLYQEEKSKA
jgi:hypothetical protein